jgi:hypothetical protein
MKIQKEITIFYSRSSENKVKCCIDMVHDRNGDKSTCLQEFKGFCCWLLHQRNREKVQKNSETRTIGLAHCFSLFFRHFPPDVMGK